MIVIHGSQTPANYTVTHEYTLTKSVSGVTTHNPSYPSFDTMPNGPDVNSQYFDVAQANFPASSLVPVTQTMSAAFVVKTTVTFTGGGGPPAIAVISFSVRATSNVNASGHAVPGETVFVSQTTSAGTTSQSGTADLAVDSGVISAAQVIVPLSGGVGTYSAPVSGEADLAVNQSYDFSVTPTQKITGYIGAAINSTYKLFLPGGAALLPQLGLRM